MTSAITIENLSKCYRVQRRDAPADYTTLRESLVKAASWPLRELRGSDGARHEPFWALKDVNFDVQPGEVVGIIGRNGAGKSTLLKILSRITKPTDGQAAVARPRRQPARSRHRLSSRTDRPRKHLPQRRHPRHDAPRDRRASSTRSSPSPRSSSSSTRR